ncbi:MAG: S8 family serine peptidase [Phycisphaerales bacterium]|nr:S8 family serine peptidase [Phycisphaerales bacterium]
MRGRGLFFEFILIVAVSGAAAGGPPEQQLLPARLEDGKLYLTTGIIDTTQLPQLSDFHPIAPDADATFVVQLDGPMRPEWRAALTATGAALGGYLPKNAFMIEANSAEATAVTALPFVTWLGEFQNDWKLDPHIGQRLYETEERIATASQGKVALSITLFPGRQPESAINDISAIPNAVVHGSAPLAHHEIVYATLLLTDVVKLAEIEDVQYVEESPELKLRNNTTRWIVQSNMMNVTPLYLNGLRGEGQIVGIMDGKVDVNHCSFSDVNPIGPMHRKIQAYNTSPGAESHGTHVAGTCVGDSGVFDDRRGVAYLGRMVFHDVPFPFIESEMRNRLQTHHDQGARIHTNSWGDDDTTAYNGLTRAIDSYSHDHEDGLVLFAVTNGPALRNPENAKNALAVAASEDAPTQHNHCSGGIGPTTDGRRKPEVYAPGCNTISARNNTTCDTRPSTGTSMACPAVAGIGMLIRQYFMNGYYPNGAPHPSALFTNPSGALIKAAIINSAVDMTGIAGYPSNLEGWGRVLADNVLFFPGKSRKLLVLGDQRNVDGLSTGMFDDYIINVLTNNEKLKVTLVWTDPPATLPASFAAVNDLDLEVTAPNPNPTLYRGNFFLGGVSAPSGVKDDRNNVEQVHIDVPQPGKWTIRVRGAAVNQGHQGYALLVTGDLETIQQDCNGNEIPDDCEIDCGVPGGKCDVPGCGTAEDCNSNLIPDACEPADDCNNNGEPDICDLATGFSPDCNSNKIPDECEVPPLGGGEDCNFNLVPDECEPDDDCNNNLIVDICEIAAGVSPDCNRNNIPDSCELTAFSIELFADFEGPFPPPGWSATGLWHDTNECPRSAVCAPNQARWAYYGVDQDIPSGCHFNVGPNSGVLTAPPITIPPDVTNVTMTYCSAYAGESGNSNGNPNLDFDWAWVAVNGVEEDDVSLDGDFANWQTRTVDLSAYIGQVITITWNFDSIDGMHNNELGWQIDLVKVRFEIAGGLDCNDNGVPDDCDIALSNSSDCNGNQVPDECESIPFGGQSCCDLAGDLSKDMVVNGADLQLFVSCLIAGDATAVGCECADMDSSGDFDMNDVSAFVDCLLGLSCPSPPQLIQVHSSSPIGL